MGGGGGGGGAGNRTKGGGLGTGLKGRGLGTGLKVPTAAKFDWFMFFCRWNTILRPCEPSSDMECMYSVHI